MNHFNSISQFSRWILKGSLLFTTILFLKMVIIGQAANILIPLFAFVQPCVILYFLYWRARRQHTSLDLVIKCFAVGFLVTSSQSVSLELLALVIFLVPTGLLLPSILPPPVLPTIGSRSIEDTLSTALSSVFAIHNTLFSSEGSSFGLSPTPGISLMARYQMMSQHAHSIHLTANGDYGGGDAVDGDLLNNALRPAMKKNLIFVLFALVIFSYVIAAGVEETMKHFIVRCCPFSTPLKDPQSILGALRPVVPSHPNLYLTSSYT